MPKLCGRIVDDSYGFIVSGSCVGVSLMVAMAFRTKAVVVAKAFRAKAVRAYRAVAKVCTPKLCTVERTGQESEAKISVILALRR